MVLQKIIIMTEHIGFLVNYKVIDIKTLKHLQDYKKMLNLIELKLKHQLRFIY